MREYIIGIDLDLQLFLEVRRATEAKMSIY